MYNCTYLMGFPRKIVCLAFFIIWEMLQGEKTLSSVASVQARTKRAHNTAKLILFVRFSLLGYSYFDWDAFVLQASDVVLEMTIKITCLVCAKPGLTIKLK